MTGHDHAHPRGAGLDVEFREIVNDIDEDAAHPDQLRLAQARRPRLRVVVASDRNQGRHGGEFIQNAGAAHIAAVNDVVAAGQKRARLGP